MDKAGFTLLEVMIALAIITIALVTILYSHSLSIGRTTQARNILISSLLAQQKMAEAELLGFSAVDNAQGDFDEYPQFLWQRWVYKTPKDDFKKIVLRISWEDGQEKESTELISFLTKMR